MVGRNVDARKAVSTYVWTEAADVSTTEAAVPEVCEVGVVCIV